MSLVVLGLSAITVLLSLIFLFVLYRAVRGLVRLALGGVRAGSDKIVIKFTTFAISLFLFPGVASYALDVIVALMNIFFIEFPTKLYAMKAFADTCENLTREQCLVTIGNAMTSVWINLSETVLAAFKPSEIPIVDIVLFLAIWMFLALLLDRVTVSTTGANNLITRTITAISNVKPETKQNFSFLLVLLLSVYLGIIAIASIPTLSRPVTEKIDTSQLDKQLDVLKYDKVQFNIRFPQDLPELRLKKIYQERLNESASNKGEFHESSAKTGMNIIIDTISSTNEHLTEDWKKLRQYYLRRQDELKEAAKVAYDKGNLNRLESRVQSLHYISLIDWYRQALGEMEQRLDTCRGGITMARSQVDNLNPLLTQLLDNGGQNLPVAVAPMIQVVSSAQGLCVPQASEHAVPQRDDLGSELGPLGWPMWWLLKAESLPLALIVGLIGFGLLGSVVSGLVRRSLGGEELSSGGRYLTDTVGVVSLGVGAAILVFLAAYGGLAIFADGDAQPNAYVILFICLAAGAFSNRVWRWTESRLQTWLGDENGMAGDQPAPRKSTPKRKSK